jgi:uncharacterized membrane protein
MITLLAFGLFAGWLLGIIGFFIARGARSDLRKLRATLAQSDVSPPDVAQPATAGSVPLTLPVAPAPPVVPLPEPVTPKQRDLEALITTSWGVWVGSAALLFAGIFLVRYAVEQELLGPAARCCIAALLGFALLAGAEFLRRHEGPPLPGPFRRDQAPGGLAAGGTAILLGAAYGAGPFFDLLPPLLAFMAMSAASLIGLASALRYGPLTAATGIVGAFATPALVATQAPSLPGLFAYLAIVSIAALLVVRRTAWTWLGWATTVAGAIWVCIAAIPPASDSWPAAAFVAAQAALVLLLLPAAALSHQAGRRLAWVPFAAMGTAGLVLEAFTPGLAPRVALFVLSPIAGWKGVAEPRLDRLPWVAALLGMLTLLIWPLPTWTSSAEVIRAEGIVQAILPGEWTPDAIIPFLSAAALLVAFNATVGLWQERRAPHPLSWAGLVGAVPVLILAIAYARITQFQTGIAHTGIPQTGVAHIGLAWSGAALAVTAALTFTAAAATREGDRQRAGIHAAGAVAALSLGCAMLLQDYWLTLAFALLLPPLAWIEARAELPQLRPVAVAVAVLVIARLVLNWYVLDYAFGTMASGLVVGYVVPGVMFAAAAVLFRRRADDTLVATLESGAVTFLALFVALEIRHWAGEGRLDGPVSFTEVALHVLTTALQAAIYLYLDQRNVTRGKRRMVLLWAWQILGGLGLIEAVAVLVLNPMVTDASTGSLGLLAAYLLPGCLAGWACWSLPGGQLRTGIGACAVAAGFAWITLQIRLLFHPDAMGLDAAPIEPVELWSWSGAWLAFGIGLMTQAIRHGQRKLRLTALGVIGLVCAKVFVIDMSGLNGLWRVLSFLGLGLALIGLGAVYRRFVLPTGQT